MKPKYCLECKWSKPQEYYEWNLKCVNPYVNAKDSWALAATKIEGSSARDEREKRYFAECGMKGKLWEQK